MGGQYFSMLKQPTSNSFMISGLCVFRVAWVQHHAPWHETCSAPEAPGDGNIFQRGRGLFVSSLKGGATRC